MEDTLEAWLRLRASLSLASLPPSATTVPTPPTASTTTALTALNRFIDRRVRPGDALRADRCAAAVAVLASLVSDPPSVDGLRILAARLQGLDSAAPLRTTTAWAHGGRAVMRPFSRAEFEEAIRGADIDDDGPAWLRGARLYADICFFHPMDDGNARLALCALVWVLERGRVAVVDLSPVVMPWVPSTAPALCRVVRATTRG